MTPRLTAAVITVSDRASAGVYLDRSGPLAAELLRAQGCQVVRTDVVGDDAPLIAEAIGRALDGGVRLVLTTGGTGVGPRDVTPEATRPLLSRELPGIAEEIRRRGGAVVPTALLSRALVGLADRPERPSALIVNAPGSVGGVRDTIAVIGPLLGSPDRPGRRRRPPRTRVLTATSVAGGTLPGT